MGSVQDAFKYNKARKNVIVGGVVILICITALSCISSFMIYRSGFGDMPFIFQQALSLFAVVVVEGAFVWLVYGFTRHDLEGYCAKTIHGATWRSKSQGVS